MIWLVRLPSYLLRALPSSWLASWVVRASVVKVWPGTVPCVWARWLANFPLAERRCLFATGLLLLLCPFRHRLVLLGLGLLTLALGLPFAMYACTSSTWTSLQPGSHASLISAWERDYIFTMHLVLSPVWVRDCRYL